MAVTGVTLFCVKSFFPPAELLSKLGGFHAIAGNQQRDWKFMSVRKVGNQVYGIQ